MDKLKITKERAEYYYKNKIRVFIKGHYGDLFFGDIQEVNDNSLNIYITAGRDIDKIKIVDFIDIHIISKYRTKEEINND